MTDAADLILSYCAKGDEQAFRCFYRVHSPKLWKFLAARGCDREAAYDLLAEAFLRFVQTVCRDPSAPVAFLYRIALNLRIDAYRREKTRAIDAQRNLEELQLAVGEEPDDYGQVRALIKRCPRSSKTSC